ncbi:MAG: SAM-dependent methyltransferase [Deltaproteobacteria bacterium]|nr:SAM-dependent methyltransferase [Deltaproteobacteria bacterium]
MSGEARADRVVHCADAMEWLRAQTVLEGCSIFTSLPDATELPGVDQARWRAWFMEAAGLCVSRTPDAGVTLFYQSDVKRQGTWVDKAYLVQRAVEDAGSALLFHKIVCRFPPGTVTHGRAAYGHLLAFSKGVRVDLARATADVLPEQGHMTWVRAIGLSATRAGCRFVQEHTQTRTVVDPFCGVGTVLAVANELGLSAVGVELNRKRAQKARSLVVAGG